VALNLWTTRSAELVGVGDTVALSVLEHADAIGRIIARTGGGRIRCLLVCHSCRPGKFVIVDEDQLLLRLDSRPGHVVLNGRSDLDKRPRR
jgi:hypothetical protein